MITYKQMSGIWDIKNCINLLTIVDWILIKGLGADERWYDSRDIGNSAGASVKRI